MTASVLAILRPLPSYTEQPLEKARRKQHCEVHKW